MYNNTKEFPQSKYIGNDEICNYNVWHVFAKCTMVVMQTWCDSLLSFNYVLKRKEWFQGRVVACRPIIAANGPVRVKCLKGFLDNFVNLCWEAVSF